MKENQDTKKIVKGIAVTVGLTLLMLIVAAVGIIIIWGEYKIGIRIMGTGLVLTTISGIAGVIQFINGVAREVKEQWED